MGTTNKLGLPWPADTSFLKDIANAVRTLAEGIEDYLLSPLLVTDGDGTLTWDAKVAEVPWDVTDSPDRKRGGWDSPGNAEKLVIPSKPGWYLVTTAVTFTGKAEPDVYDVSIRTREQGTEVGTGTVWGRDKRDVPNSSADDSVITVATVVRVADTAPRTGIAVRVNYKGATQPPNTTAGQNKLRIHWLSGL